MGWTGMIAAVAWSLVAAPQTAPQDAPRRDRLYGRVATEDGAVLEGYLRWDRNEGSWSDFLDGAKELPWENLREAERLDEEYARQRERERSITVMGLRITWDEDPQDEMQTSASAVRFGHIESLVAIDDGRVRLTLKSGREQDLVWGGTDLGRGFRGLLVYDAVGEPVELRWRDLARIDFMAVPADAPPPRARRLFGTLSTRGGRELTGFVSWDLDEILTTDVLDGESGGEDHEIAFGRIAAIEWESASSARVILTDGQELVLSNTNDVNAANRGIEISDPGLGRAVVGWGAFGALRFHPAQASLAGYDTFDGGRPLHGTVETQGGAVVAGALRWDNDEVFTWETLDGVSDDVAFSVELGRVRSIARTDAGVEVALRDGRVLTLAGSADVDRENRGVFVRPDGGATVFVSWRDVHSVVIDP